MHFTAANLTNKLHRAVEHVQSTAHAARACSPTATASSCTTPLPSTPAFGDEGAANHTRFASAHGAAGVEFFVYGRVEFDPSAPEPEEIPGAPDPGSLAGDRSPARPGRRAHRVRAAEPGRDRPGRVPQRRDRGRQRQRAVLPRAGLRRRSGDAGRAAPRAGRRRRRPAAPCACDTGVVPVADAVASYLFNSQLLSQAGRRHGAGGAARMPRERRRVALPRQPGRRAAARSTN